MPELDEIASGIRSRLDEKDRAREEAIRAARGIVKEARRSIASLHRGVAAEGEMREAERLYGSLRALLAEFPDLLHSGYLVTAQQELVEANILLAVLREVALPDPGALNVSDEAYLLGLGDAIGEMRRLLLDRLMDERIDEAENILGRMEEFYSVLVSFDYPEALVAIRRKQDVARGLLEKSRGELVLAKQMAELRSRLEGRR